MAFFCHDITTLNISTLEDPLEDYYHLKEQENYLLIITTLNISTLEDTLEDYYHLKEQVESLCIT